MSRFFGGTFRAFGMISAFTMVFLLIALGWMWMAGKISTDKLDRTLRIMNNRVPWTPVILEKPNLSPQERERVNRMLEQAVVIQSTVPLPPDEQRAFFELMEKNGYQTVVVTRLPSEVGQEFQEIHDRQKSELENRAQEITLRTQVLESQIDQLEIDRAELANEWDRFQAEKDAFDAAVKADAEMRQKREFTTSLKALATMDPGSAAAFLVAQRKPIDPQYPATEELDVPKIIAYLQELKDRVRGDLLMELQEIQADPETDKGVASGIGLVLQEMAGN
jgi:hypothetical protein